MTLGPDTQAAREWRLHEADRLRHEIGVLLDELDAALLGGSHTYDCVLYCFEKQCEGTHACDSKDHEA